MRPWKACGFELSTPDRFAPMSTHSSVSPLGFWSPVVRHRSLPSWPRVIGHRSRPAGRPSLFALSEAEGHSPRLARSTSFQLRFWESGRLHRSPNTGPLASNSGFGSPVDSPGVQRPDLQPQERLSPLQSALTKIRACKSFRIHSYKFIGLKVPWNETLTKNTGGGGGPPEE